MIIIHGSRYVGGGSCSKDDWARRKDELHKRRKELEADLRPTIFSKDKMNMRDCKNEYEETRRVEEYEKWKTQPDRSGKTNEEKMREWSEVNREFKKHGEEGMPHTVDDIRIKKEIKYD